jgi:anti-sigma factor RsiW
MIDPRCEQLDEYLCGWLAPEEAAAFEAHLAACPTCREEAALQRRIDRLTKEAAEIEPIPVAVAGRVERALRRARRRRRVAWLGAATTAAALAIAVGIWESQTVRFARNGRRLPADTPSIATAVPEPFKTSVAAEPRPAIVARVTATDPSAAIVVPVESHRPNITLVCIYPTIKIAAADDSKSSP